MTTDDLDFDLPSDLVAQHPAPERGASQLMVLRAGSGMPIDVGRFDGLFVDQLDPSDLVVANDARVLHARLRLTRPTGGAAEVLLLTPVGPGAAAGSSRWNAMARPARKLRDGMVATTQHGDESVTFVRRTSDQTWEVDLPVEADDVPVWLLAHGELPLPPYVHERGQDPNRYQTVHARAEGSVAAPTAGLHFDDSLWTRVRDRCDVVHLTLHVGAGTFLPVSDGALADHAMHHERYEVPPDVDEAIRAARSEGRRIVAIGTTSTRVLEHVYGSANQPLRGETDLFLVPGHEWACVGAMLTNFHLPKSTLIALVMSFLGEQSTREAYAEAIRRRMRFYSFGDAMFVHGPPEN